MEIKRTVLPPYGGPREESGSNGSLWSMGGGIVRSPGAEDNRVVVPNLIGVEANNERFAILSSLGLDSINTSTSMYYPGAIINYQSPSAGTLVSPGSVIEYRYPNPNWITSAWIVYPGFGPDGGILAVSPGDASTPSEWAAIIANPTNYNVVITGGSQEGTYSNIVVARIHPKTGYPAQLGSSSLSWLELQGGGTNGIGLSSTTLKGNGIEESAFMSYTPDNGIVSIVSA